MVPPAGPVDRYEPLPGLLGMPGFFWRKLSPGGRRLAALTGAALVVGAIALAIVLVPVISDAKRENAAEERREAERVLAAQRARLRAEQRPRRGTVPSAAVVAGVEERITADARARHAAGELDVAALRTDCSSLGHDQNLTLLGCTAVTSDVEQSDQSTGVLIGYPYRAAVDLQTGRYALCKTSGRPGEGAYDRGLIVPLPAACGG